MLVSLQEEELPLPAPSGSVASVGVFDGVHRGHREILRTNVARARELGARPTVVTFREHPKTVLLGRAPLYGFAACGPAGVAEVLALLREEFEITLRLLGQPRVDRLDTTVLVPDWAERLRQA